MLLYYHFTLFSSPDVPWSNIHNIVVQLHCLCFVFLILSLSIFYLNRTNFWFFKRWQTQKIQSPIRTDCFSPQLLFSTKSHRTLETNPISTSSKLARSKPSKILFRSFEFVFCFLFLCFLLLVEFLLDSIVVVSTILVLVSTCVFPHLFLPCPVLSRTSSWHSRVEVYYLFCNR